ncbi:MAG: hypothetical protein L6Q94_20395 [Calditrichia bacterium]|nr:hypothetical protein [Calditrichia bacterium]
MGNHGQSGHQYERSAPSLTFGSRGAKLEQRLRKRLAVLWATRRFSDGVMGPGNNQLIINLFFG